MSEEKEQKGSQREHQMIIKETKRTQEREVNEKENKETDYMKMIERGETCAWQTAH